MSCAHQFSPPLPGTGAGWPVVLLIVLVEEPPETPRAALCARFSRATVWKTSGGSAVFFSEEMGGVGDAAASGDGDVADDGGALDRGLRSNKRVMRTASGIPNRFG